jgi:hypothetical protein
MEIELDVKVPGNVILVLRDDYGLLPNVCYRNNAQWMLFIV